MSITVTTFGSCRQHSLINNNDNIILTSIQEKLDYPHYTKEILECIRYLKYKHIPDNFTQFIMRTPIINKKHLENYDQLKEEFEKTDIFILEIASKLTYKWNNFYVHHIASEPQWNPTTYNEVKISEQTKEEIEQDILDIQKELNKPIIIVCHFYSYTRGNRYILTRWLKNICEKYNIPFIDPVDRLKNESSDLLFIKEDILAHYTEFGHNKIKNIYIDEIKKII